MKMSGIDATNAFVGHLSSLARDRLEEINRETGANLPSIVEALVMRCIDDLGPGTMRRLFPDKFGEVKRTVVAVTKIPELGRIRMFSDGTWEVICERIVLAEDAGKGMERRLWSDGKTEWVPA